MLGVFHNARRRSDEGTYDDAIARLYRCLEMIEQHLLFIEHNLVTSEINPEDLKNKIPLDFFQKLCDKKKYDRDDRDWASRRF
ncbi:MAG: hypothetical protein WBX01_00740 [Nitrososphaeraceae archaeon]